MALLGSRRRAHATPGCKRESTRAWAVQLELVPRPGLRRLLINSGKARGGRGETCAAVAENASRRHGEAGGERQHRGRPTWTANVAPTGTSPAAATSTGMPARPSPRPARACSIVTAERLTAFSSRAAGVASWGVPRRGRSAGRRGTRSHAGHRQRRAPAETVTPPTSQRGVARCPQNWLSAGTRSMRRRRSCPPPRGRTARPRVRRTPDRQESGQPPQARATRIPGWGRSS